MVFFYTSSGPPLFTGGAKAYFLELLTKNDTVERVTFDYVIDKVEVLTPQEMETALSGK